METEFLTKDNIQVSFVFQLQTQKGGETRESDTWRIERPHALISHPNPGVDQLIETTTLTHLVTMINDIPLI